MMTNRQWFRMYWFYLRAALFGEPVERKPKTTPVVQRTRTPRTAQLKPAPYAK